MKYKVYIQNKKTDKVLFDAIYDTQFDTLARIRQHNNKTGEDWIAYYKDEEE
jgi:hypothetical protein